MKQKFCSWSLRFRNDKRNFYLNKYFNIYMNSYEFSGAIDYQQIDFILRKFWRDGTIACFPLKDKKGTIITSDKVPEGELVFTTYAPNGWNIYDFPTTATMINPKGVNFIPVGPQVIDKDVVIGFIQRNKKGVAEYVESVVEDIVDAEVVLAINLKAHKMPWLIAIDPDTENKMKELYRKIAQDDTELFVSSEDANAIKVLTSGAPYIIDKLYNYIKAREDSLREFFGEQNLGVGEKKEHLISNEVQANNQIVLTSKGCLIDPMKEFFERTYEVFGIRVNVEVREKPVIQGIENDDPNESNEDEDGGNQNED